ncbi:MAG: M48 family metallopeptidase [Magnetospirillum sp.]|nr:M48 family metallopeptidase [Magnetospirillum sp.]
MFRSLSRLAALAPVFALCAVLALGACAPTTERPTVDSAASGAEAKLQRGMAFDNLETQRLRLNDVAFRVLSAGAELCGTRVRPAGGFSLRTAAMYSGAMREAARDKGINEAVAVASVTAGGPAALAGLHVGDVIERIGDTPIPAGRDGMAAVEKALATKDPAVTVRVSRDGTPLEATLQRVPSCDYQVVYQQNPQLNAYADGSRIVMFSGMVRFASTDEELALIVAHELAHNMRGHIDAKQGNAVIGAILDGLLQGLTGVRTGGAFMNAAANANSPDFEAEADYVGLYVMARAGFAIDNAPQFWRRMAVENPGGISHTSTHPATNDRFVALQAAIAEIDAKRAAGAPLVPNEKKAVTTVEPPK